MSDAKKSPAAITISADTTYYPTWLADNGVDAEAVAKAVMAINVADRHAAHMKYRGKPMPRSKWFFVDSLVEVPIYTYPGHQYKTAALEYKQMDTDAIIAGLQQLIARQFGHVTNH